MRSAENSWHMMSVEDVLEQTAGNLKGLDDGAVQKKLAENGKNELVSKKKVRPLVIFLHQFSNIMILVLAGAAVLSFFIGEVSDTIVIVVILVLNAVIGFIQEYRAERAIDALRNMTTTTARVLRNNKETEIAAEDLVPGDLVLIEAGGIVPADLRVLESFSLAINEAGLTGESVPVSKSADILKEDNLPLGDRVNLAFKSTQVTSGKGKGIVVATGMQTEVGKIAGMLDEANSTTPLQKRLGQFSRKLTLMVIGLCIVFFFVGYFRGEEITNMILVSISLAVAAIPEALPAVVTISLAMGAKKLIRQHVLIRKLFAVETLGSVTYICTDKTGTLTKNEMSVRDVRAADTGKEELLLQAMNLNHDVKEEDGKTTGDPTEIAMVKHAGDREDLERVNEIPFDAERKLMTTIHRRDDHYWVITKGASEAVRAITGNKNDAVNTGEEEMAANGMRVISFAEKTLKELPGEITPGSIEKDMQFMGFVGLMDPPRGEAADAIKACKVAGIVPVMITGDHPLTAGSIAKQIGIIESDDEEVITGRELEELTDDTFQAKVEKIRVYARVSPEQKLRIIEALQQKGHFVSMTGDGVNDAPSLKKANIGIAMGKTGTDVTKEAAHMILLDDNFATIVSAVRTGRRIYDNIRKFIKYILTGNTAEIWTLFIALMIGLPIPLLPVHILWINLVTDGMPALALAAEPAEKNIMKLPPRNPGESVFAGGLGIHVLWVGLFIGTLTVGSQWFLLDNENTNWQTIIFTMLCFCQLWHVLAIRSERMSLFQTGFSGNKPLLLAVLVTVLLQIAVIYIPFLNDFFHTRPLSWREILITVGLSSLVLLTVETEKFFKRLKGTSRERIRK